MGRKMGDLVKCDVDKLVVYDHQEGVLYWLVSRPNGIKAGDVAGCYSQGRNIISLHGKRYLTHRVAWLIMTGNWPEHEIDHIDGNPSNNAWHNLRACTRHQNARNTGVPRNNKLGIKGVRRRPTGKFQVRVHGKSYGEYEDLELAEFIAREVRLCLHKEFARG